MQDHTLTPILHRPNVEQWFANPFVQTFATSDALGWNNITVRSVGLSPTPDFNPTPYTENDTLILTFEGSACAEGRAGGHFFKRHIVAGVLLIYPRGCEQTDGRWDAPIKGLFIELPRREMVSFASSTVYGDPERVEIGLRIGFYDPLLRHLATELHREMQNASLFGPLFAESITDTIILHLLRNYSNVSTLHHISGGRLTSSQLRIIDEYIHAHLHKKISLTDLANCLHVSVPHFEKMFRATLHCPPYRYVLECRIERAKLLLSDTQRSLYDVARDCGFADQSHFTRHFTKLVGISPARFMRGMRR